MTLFHFAIILWLKQFSYFSDVDRAPRALAPPPSDTSSALSLDPSPCLQSASPWTPRGLALRARAFSQALVAPLAPCAPDVGAVI